MRNKRLFARRLFRRNIYIRACIHYVQAYILYFIRVSLLHFITDLQNVTERDRRLLGNNSGQWFDIALPEVMTYQKTFSRNESLASEASVYLLVIKLFLNVVVP